MGRCPRQEEPRTHQRRAHLVIAEALRRGIATIDEIHAITKIDKWFLYKIQNITAVENKLKEEALTPSLMLEAKNIGLADRSIADYADTIWHVPYKK